jgi:hypothetical protein
MLVPARSATEFANVVTSAHLKINARLDERSLSEYSLEESLSEIHTSLVSPLSEFLSYVCIKKIRQKRIQTLEDVMCL